MRLKSLLLGSSAAVFVGGASISGAQAADPNPAGLVVATMANYVESCNSGNGFKKGNWCLTLAGDMTFTARFGYDISIDYQDVANPAFSDEDLSTITRDIFQNSGDNLFAVGTNLALSVTRDDVSIRFPILGSSLQMVVGDLTLTKDGLSWRPTFGGFTLGLLLRESNTLGWVDALGDNTYGGVATVPDVGVEVGFGMFDFEGHYGRRSTTGAGTADYVETVESPIFNTFGFSARAEVPLGPMTVTARASWDRIPVITDVAQVGVAGDNLDTIEYEDGNAWALQGMVAGGFGPVNIKIEGAYARNFGGYMQLGATTTRIYPYDLMLEGRYIFVGGTLELEFGADGKVTAGATYATGPQPGDTVLTATGGVEMGLGMVDGLTVRAGVSLDRQVGGGPINLLGMTAGFTYVPGGNLPGVTITGLVGHERDLNGIVPPATRGQMTVKVAF